MLLLFKFINIISRKIFNITEKVNTLPPFEIAKRMLKLPYWKKYGKGFEKKIIKKYKG